MAVHKLNIDEIDQLDYHLIAIHSPLEDFRLAYFLNRQLKIKLYKKEKQEPENQYSFSQFIYDDDQNGLSWILFKNKNRLKLTENQISKGLFAEMYGEIVTHFFLLPDFKKADYILRIEDCPAFYKINEIVNEIGQLESIITAYSIDINKIKSKNNLIF